MSRRKPVVRLQVVDVERRINDLRFWCGPEGEELIVEELQSNQLLKGFNFSRDWRPTTEKIEVRRKQINNQINRVEEIFEQSKQQPTMVSYCLKDLVGDESPWRPDQYDASILFNDRLYGLNGPYSDEEFKLLCFQEFDREREFFERIRMKFHGGSNLDCSRARMSIPSRVRIFVWQRDGGKCSKCQSREGLEFDHIVPVSKGGSNTERNVELLCETCNRKKGSQIL